MIFGLIGYAWRRRTWRRIGAAMGLDLAERGLVLTGTWRGRPVTVQIYDAVRRRGERATGSDWRTEALTGLVPPLAQDITIVHRGMVARLAEAWRGPAFATGDAAFDAVCVVHTADPDATRRLLDHPLRAQLQRAFAEDDSLEVRRDTIGAERGRRISDEETFRTLLDRQADLADVIDGSRHRLGG